MNKYHLHDYKFFWIDIYGHHKKWKDISNDYLKNIYRKVKNNPRTFPAQALYYCEMELNRRKMGPAYQTHEYNTSGFDMASPTNHYKITRPTSNDAVDVLNYSLHTLINEEKTVEHKDNVEVEKPMVKTEDLAKYFNRKVKLKDGKKGTVVAIYSEKYRTESKVPYQISIMFDDPYRPSFYLTNANQVELIEVLTVYAYQSKDGTIEWTSKNYIDATLKRRGMKRLPNANKHIEID